jgi:hypothetical protein
LVAPLQPASIRLAAMTTPLLITRVLPSFGAWYNEAASSQERAETQITAGDIVNLAKEHSNKSNDPCKVQDLQVVEATHSAEEIAKIQAAALSQKELAVLLGTQSRERITSVLAKPQEQPPTEVVKGLQSLRTTQLQVITRTSELLMEIADPNSGKSIDDVLESELGAQTVTDMSEHQKVSEYKKAKQNRILQREAKTKAGVHELLTKSNVTPELAEVLKEKSQSKLLEEQKSSASASQTKIAAEVAGIQASLKKQKELFATCQSRKKAATSKKIACEAKLKEVSQPFMKAVDEFKDAYIECELLRILGSKHEQSVKDLEARLKAAQEAAQSANAACEALRQQATNESKNVDEAIRVAASTTITRDAGVLQEVLLNVQTAIELSTTACSDKDSEISNLELEKAKCTKDVEDLKLKMNHHTHDIEDVQIRHAQKKGELTKCEAKIEQCKRDLLEIQQNLSKAKAQYAEIKALEDYGLEVKEDSIIAQASDLSSSAYKNLLLWRPQGAHDVQQRQEAPSASEGVLQTIPMDYLQKIVDEMFEKKKLVLTQQIRADLLLSGVGRSGGSEASFVVVSDGQDPSPDNQDAAPENP